MFQYCIKWLCSEKMLKVRLIVVKSGEWETVHISYTSPYTPVTHTRRTAHALSDKN